MTTTRRRGRILAAVTALTAALLVTSGGGTAQMEWAGLLDDFIDPGQAKVDCGATPNVTTDGPVRVTLLGCGTRTFGQE